MRVRRLFQVLVLGGTTLVAPGCATDGAARPAGDGSGQTLPDGGVAPALRPGPPPVPTGMGAPRGW